jgi:hypothetical protein
MTILPLLRRGLGGGALAIAAIAAVSCQNKEECFDDETASAKVVAIQLSPEIPGSITPSGMKLLSSGDGGAVALEGTHALRYILEVWPDDGSACAHREVKVADDFNTPVNFSVTLTAATYQFVFWADFTDKNTNGGKNDLIYKTDNAGGLKDIVWLAPNGYEIGSNLRDAYYARETIDLSASVNNHPVILHRPFGKLRVLATDVTTAVAGGTAPPAKASLTYTHNSPDPATFRTSFNALEGTPNASPTISVTSATCTPVKEPGTTTVDGADYEDVWLLAFDYFLVPGSLPAVAFDIELFDTDGNSLSPAKIISNAPVGANKLTTVVGGVLANSADMTVSIGDDFDPASVVVVESRVPIPTRLKHTVDGNSATLTWNGDDANVDSYEIYLNEALHSTATASSATINSLTEGTTYNWKVRAVKAGIASHWSPTKTFQTAAVHFTLTVQDNLQEVKGWGVYPGHVYEDPFLNQSISAATKAQEALFDDLGVTMIRVCLEPRCGENYISANPTLLNTAYLDNLATLINAAQAKGISEYLISIWSAPYHMKETYDAASVLDKLQGKHNYRPRLKKNQYDLFVSYVKDAILYLQSKGCPPPVALSLQNEPEAGVVASSGDIGESSAFIDGADLVNLHGKMRTALNAVSLQSVKLGGPESPSYEGSWIFDGSLNFSNTDLTIMHSYTRVTYNDNSTNATKPLTDFLNLKNRIGGDSWQTEFSVAPGEGVSGATPLDRLMIAMRVFSSDMVHAGHNVWMWWCGWFPGWSENYPDDEQVLLEGNGQTTVTKSKMFEAFATIFKNVPKGSHVRKVSSSDPALKATFHLMNDLVAFRTPSGGTFILLVNGSNLEKTYDVSGLTGTSGTRIAVSGTDAATWNTSNFLVSNSTATVTVPANSVNFIYTN